MNQRLPTVCSFPIRFLQYFKCKAVVAKPMFVPNAVSAALLHISLVTKPMLVPSRFLQYFGCKSIVSNPMFVPNLISAVFRMQINGYKPYVRSQCDFYRISYINRWLQILCSFSIRFLQYFVYKSTIVNPMLILNAFVCSIWHILRKLQTQCSPQFDFCNISYINRRLQTLCSFSIRFLKYFDIDLWLQILCSDMSHIKQ